jgi:transcription elongation factor Elf1
MHCPECGAECVTEVDVGLGIPNGLWACPKCGWDSEVGVDECNKEPED